jgi:hypothetical protein
VTSWDQGDRWRGVGAGALVVAIASVTALHLLRPDLAPASSRLSEYANGPFSPLMAVAFAGLGVGLIAIGGAIHRDGTRTARLWAVSTLLVAAGTGMLISGVFRSDPDGVGTRAELVHSAASGLATSATVAAAAVHSLPYLRPSSRWQVDALAAWLAMTGVVLAAGSPLLHDTPWTGISQRVLWGVLLAWVLRATYVSSVGRRRLRRPLH